ncbi:MAG: histidine phosphatase family protein [Leptolyngbya sp. SIO1E4]|nr:histidine phosphatase family protein [Leptolyngbya sp. SIO1E4]
MQLTSLPTRVIFVRHGRSTYNEQGRYQGSSDQAVLTANGHRTAQLVGQALQSEKIHAIYSSPLKRVQQTVDAICDQLPSKAIPMDVRDDLREIDLPAWEGLPYKTVRTHQVDTYRCWIERPHEFQMARCPHSSFDAERAAPESFYPVRDLYGRAQRFWHTVLPQHAGQTLLVVSHGGTIHALISTALGLTPEQHHCLQQSNCGVSVLEFPPAANFAQLCQLNDTGAIGELLPKLKAGRQGLRLLLLPVEPEMPLNGVPDFLEEIHLDFSLQTHGLISDFQTAQLLSNHPETVQLQVQREDFIQAWQQTLNLRGQQSSETLLTGLVIASPDKIQALLMQIIGIAPHEDDLLSLNPGRMSVVHFANSQSRPILQGLNIYTNCVKRHNSVSPHNLLVAV